MKNLHSQRHEFQHPDNIDLSVIIVNYNTSDLLIKCLLSIEKQDDINYEVYVVDNASNDSSVKMVKSQFGWAKLIENKSNAGFSRANNQAISKAKGPYFLFLNPDTIVHEGAFASILLYFKTFPRVGLAGLSIVNTDGSPQPSVEYRYPGQRHARKELQGLPGEIAWLLGAGIVARNNVIHAINGFDERFFLYGEDIDLCLSTRKAGWEIGLIPNAIITHWGGKANGNPSPLKFGKKNFQLK